MGLTPTKTFKKIIKYTMYRKLNQKHFYKVRAFSCSPFKENNRDKLKKYIFGLFNSVISKILFASTKKSVEDFTFFLKEYDQKIAKALSPLALYQKILLIPSFVYLLSHIFFTIYLIEIQFLVIEPNEQLINFISYPKDNEGFKTFAVCSVFTCMVTRIPTQIKETKKIIEMLNHEKDEAEKNGTPLSKMQKRAMFTAAGKFTVKNAAKACALCAGGLVTTDECTYLLTGYKPINEASMYVDGVITKEEYYNHLNNRSTYRTINSKHGVGTTQADQMAKDFLSGKIKPEHSEYDKYLDITRKIGPKQESK
jgi:hypothetical protein